jgi:hypothetical protein
LSTNRAIPFSVTSVSIHNRPTGEESVQKKLHNLRLSIGLKKKSIREEVKLIEPVKLIPHRKNTQIPIVKVIKKKNQVNPTAINTNNNHQTNNSKAVSKNRSDNHNKAHQEKASIDKIATLAEFKSI